uniref:Uncharacterized protein n=1 Tax=Aegilops tauschii subsp. strangulata TaxID=200361 RepID=A0A453AKF9_AEGTS
VLALPGGQGASMATCQSFATSRHMSQHLHARMEQSAHLLAPTLARPKLTTKADELPEAVVVQDAGDAMAGFVGLLRQLGDLAQYVAPILLAATNSPD